MQKNPDDPEAYLQLGEIALNQRRFAEADLCFTKAASLMKTFNKSAERKAKLMPRIYSDMAAISEVREDWPVAQQRLEEALKLDPKNVKVMQRIAKALFQQKKAQEALEKLREAANSSGCERAHARGPVGDLLSARVRRPGQREKVDQERLGKAAQGQRLPHAIGGRQDLSSDGQRGRSR